MTQLRRWLGVWLADVPQLLKKTQSGDDWVTIVNRLGEHSFEQDPVSVRCLSNETSSLHVSDVLPWTGKRIFSAVRRQWDFAWKQEIPEFSDPEISVLIPIRGTQRLPLLNATIASLAAMETPFEIIVIEQDCERRIRELPTNVRHLHAPHPSNDSRWHKCFAYNRGAEIAKGDILICHDGDIVVPKNYEPCIRRHLIEEHRDVFFPGRFLFYLTEFATNNVLANKSFESASDHIPEIIKQNWTGGTLAIKKEAFESVGGYDESFTGWTGEDREFYDRCQLLNGMFHSYIPFLHLWHPPQSGRVDADALRAANEFTRAKLAIDRAERVRMLKSSKEMRDPEQPQQ